MFSLPPLQASRHELRSWARQASPQKAAQLLKYLLERQAWPGSEAVELSAQQAQRRARHLVRSLSAVDERLFGWLLNWPLLWAPLAENQLLQQSFRPRLRAAAMTTLEELPDTRGQVFRPTLTPAAAIEEMIQVLASPETGHPSLSSSLQERVVDLVALNLYFDLPPSVGWAPHYHHHIKSLAARKLFERLIPVLTLGNQQLWTLLETVSSQRKPESDVYQALLFHDRASATLWHRALVEHDLPRKLVTQMTLQTEFLCDRACRQAALGRAGWIGHWHLIRASDTDQERNEGIRQLAQDHPQHLLYILDQSFEKLAGSMEARSLSPLLAHRKQAIRAAGFTYIRKLEARTG